MWWILKKLAGSFVSALTGGSLEKILDTINKKMDATTQREQIKSDVTKKWIDAQANLLVGRTWWFQLFFIIPLGIHWAALNYVSAFPQFGWTVHPLPAPFDEWAGWIISALFIVDGGKALLGRMGK